MNYRPSFIPVYFLLTGAATSVSFRSAVAVNGLGHLVVLQSGYACRCPHQNHLYKMDQCEMKRLSHFQNVARLVAGHGRI